MEQAVALLAVREAKGGGKKKPARAARAEGGASKARKPAKKARA